MLGFRSHGLAANRADRFDFARLPRHVFKCEQIAVGNLAVPEGTPVHKQFHVAAIGGHIEVLSGAGGIVPVADNVQLRVVAIHRPADIVRLLGQARTILADARHALHTWSERSVAASASLSAHSRTEA